MIYDNLQPDHQPHTTFQQKVPAAYRYHCVHVQKIFIISISILHYYTVMQE